MTQNHRLMGDCVIHSPLGATKITGDIQGISSIKVYDEPQDISKNIPIELQDCTSQLDAYFQKKIKSFNLKLNPKGTEFQKKVWEALLRIPFGKTISYLELSKQLGDVKAIRAVASANGKNPLWIVVPCHRVIGSDGSLTGYAGGLHRKQWLLNHESEVEQLKLF